MSTTLQVRIDPKTKKAASKVFSNLGMDMSSAIKLYLQKVIATESIPFQIITQNGLTLQEELEILKASEEAKLGINVTKPMKRKEALEYLDKLKNDDFDGDYIHEKIL
ncbi:MAG: type II toxin-antitoxin system RelB/DinJ family antitoxin [bacterium]|nr:type II toxin-antitoxin system RelB/DinJ family antitoxin [bacterium]